MELSLTNALIAAVGTLTTVVLALWRENLKWQERWAEEVRCHSQNTELFNRALEKLLSESSTQDGSDLH